MSDDKDKKPPEEGEERTVFMPSLPDAPAAGGDKTVIAPAPDSAGAEPPPPADTSETLANPEPPKTAETSETLSNPVPSAPAAADEPAAPDAPAEAAGGTAAGLSPTNFAPREVARAIQVGDVLNHIFKVNRFLARGGMGEVFEGCNVNTDEKVAIKVMLPALAADEKVVAMFRKEARTLTKLHHECIVQYRVLAQEPQLGVLYIVTDYIDGKNLADVLAELKPSPDDLAVLLQRLAAGLGAAHKMDLVHRDMSPDNVILPGGDIRQAKIIDFGIAKDLDASSATIVGDGFAGKLNYVAPEQLGDFGREVGPWTDVYSLALVILAVAQGKNVNMSGSLVDAIDKRRQGPDLAAAPDNLRPLLAAMLRPDPKERLRSLDEVQAMLGGAPVPAAPTTPPTSHEVIPAKGPPVGLIVGGVIAGAIVIGAAAWYALGGSLGGLLPGGGNANTNGSVVAPAADPAAAARDAINSVLPSVSCTWLDIGSVQESGGSVSVAMRGVAGDSDAARQEISRALTGAGLRNARVDFGDVAPITQAGCAALDTYRQVRVASGSHLSLEQPRFEMMMQPPGLPYAGEVAANAAIDFDFGNSGGDFAIVGIEPSGTITTLIPGRAEFEAALAQSVNGRPIADLRNGRYRLNIDLDHRGWSGIMLVSGQGPFVPDLVAPPVGSRGPSWQQQFLAAAAQGNWRVEMVWFESVDRVPGDAAPPISATPAPEAEAEPAPDGGGGKEP
ncbi:MAG TPA: serine/threonine-protein kinase [Allosphingosinicella sp.]|nr:serine/threonine-protein kinase [Allosphingosinicella sp.]